MLKDNLNIEFIHAWEEKHHNDDISPTYADAIIWYKSKIFSELKTLTRYDNRLEEEIPLFSEVQLKNLYDKV